VENENLNNCLFTGDLSAQDLYTKLRILTLTINASYEINGTKILLKGEGCGQPPSS
jgi:transmembrane sensor